MRDDITMQHHPSLAGRIHQMIPDMVNPPGPQTPSAADLVERNFWGSRGRIHQWPRNSWRMKRAAQADWWNPAWTHEPRAGECLSEEKNN